MIIPIGFGAWILAGAAELQPLDDDIALIEYCLRACE